MWKYVCVCLFPCLLSCAVAPFDEYYFGTHGDLCLDRQCPIDARCVVVGSDTACVPIRPPAEVCSTPCPAGYECRYDVCVATDPVGKVCEYDDVCGDSELCILGRCSPAVCEPGTLEACYTGDATTLDVGECRGGFIVCTSEGVYDPACLGEVTPAGEFGLARCNGLDDDCDGVDDPSVYDGLNIIFAFDVSGSMSAEFPYVAEAIAVAASHYNFSNVRLSLLLFPGSNDPNNRWTPHVIIPLMSYDDFTVYADVLQALIQALEHVVGGSQEPSWDVPQAIVDGYVTAGDDDPPLHDPAARTAVIMFTDEGGQSFMTERNTEESMCALVRANDLMLYTVTLPEFFEDFDDCGETYELVFDADVMASQLVSITDSVCNSI